MGNHATAANSRFQVSLWQFLIWMTAVCVVCALAHGLINHLRYVEAKDGSIPAEVVGQSLFFGFLIVAAFVGLMVGPPLCYLVALWHSRRGAGIGRDRTSPR